MKAERRHQLQTNSLAHVMENLPEYGKRYGSQILLAITVLLLIGVVIRWRLTSAEDGQRNAALSLDSARAAVEGVRIAPFRAMMEKGESLSSLARKNAAEAETAISDVFNSTDDPQYIARARILRGDLNWALANIGEGTSPNDKLSKTSAEYLAEASEAYESVLKPDAKSPAEAVITAHFSMAAVNENQQRWDDARKHYEAVQNNASAGDAFKDRAKDQIARLEKIRVAPLLATAPALDAADSQLPSDIFGPPKPTSAPTTKTTEPAKTEPAKPPAAGVEPAKPDPAKPDAPKPEPVKPEAPKTDAPKADAPKPDAPKPDPPKPEAATPTPPPAAEPPKPDAPKSDASKPDASKTN